MERKNELTRYATLAPAVVDQTLTSVGISLGNHGYLIVPVLLKSVILIVYYNNVIDLQCSSLNVGVFFYLNLKMIL